VFNRLFELALSKQTYVILFSSLARMLLSLFLATFLGVFMGLVSGVNTKVEAFLKPIIITIRTLPVISIIVVVLIIFGNEITLYIISLLLLFPIIYQAELDGIKHIDPRVVDVLKLETKKVNKVVVFNIYLPLSIPFLRTALIDAVGLGFKVLVIAEYIAQTNSSIGKTIYMNKINLDFTGVFAWTIVLLIFVLVIEWIVERVLKTK
jgi:NitT/TauT family transport system permease protein